MLRVILVDDEPLARQGMRHLLGEFPDVEIIGEAEHVQSARELVAQKNPDALFLDIRMPGADGFELARGLQGSPKVVFVTAYSEHAVKAFEVDAVDYLLKPVPPERLGQAVRRLLTACSAQQNTEQYRMEDRICLRTPERTLVARLESIVALAADGDFTKVFVANEPTLMIWQTLSSFEKTLPDPPFTRLDRSLLINLSRVTATRRLSRNELELSLEGAAQPFLLGRVAQSRLRTRLNTTPSGW